MFSASVIELHNAPAWNVVPKRRFRLSCCSCGDDIAFGRALQPDHRLQERTFAAARAAHDDEHVAATDREIQVSLNEKIPVRHREVFYNYLCVGTRHLKFQY
jgi:hypothetical protein